METTGLDRCVDARAINRRRELWHARRFRTLSSSASNDWIAETISAGRPAAIGMMGMHECGALAAHLGLRQFYKYTWAAPSYSEAALAKVGIFPPSDEMYWRFAELFLERLRNFDGYAVGLHIGESEVVAQYCPAVQRLERRALEPYFFEAPWSARLAGKRVLVIHPFHSSIRAQFSRREAIWPGQRNILPAFELEITQSPLGFSRSGFNDWFAMLAWFEERVAAIHRRFPFEVALIGAGPAGAPLTVFVKKLGAVGIHLGDAAAGLFGIRDDNAERRPELQSFFNDAWVRPLPNEIPFVATSGPGASDFRI